MTFIEKNGGKVAATLCVASAFPLVGTVYAMEANTNANDSENVVVATTHNSDLTNTDYFVEGDGEKTLPMTNQIEETIKTAAIAAVREENISETKFVPAQEAPVKEEVVQDSENTTDENIIEDTPITLPETAEETPVVDDTQVSDAVTDSEQVKENVSETLPNVTPEPNPAPVPEVPQPSVTPEINQVPEQSSSATTQPGASTENVTPEPSTQEPNLTPEQVPSDATVTNDLNARIAAEAQKLVDVTNGLQCTQVVQLALANAGVSDAYQLWPDQYCGVYGYYTDNPQPGNLIYYNNGGRGVDHIAIYIGNGMAVHGNYWIDGTSYTVIEKANIPGVGTPQYIQVVR